MIHGSCLRRGFFLAMLGASALVGAVNWVTSAQAAAPPPVPVPEQTNPPGPKQGRAWSAHAELLFGVGFDLATR